MSEPSVHETITPAGFIAVEAEALNTAVGMAGYSAVRQDVDMSGPVGGTTEETPSGLEVAIVNSEVAVAGGTAAEGNVITLRYGGTGDTVPVMVTQVPFMNTARVDVPAGGLVDDVKRRLEVAFRERGHNLPRGDLPGLVQNATAKAQTAESRARIAGDVDIAGRRILVIPLEHTLGLVGLLQLQLASFGHCFVQPDL